MATYSFTVAVEGFDSLEKAEAALYESGCNDALLVSIDRALRVDFDREASSYADAVDTAVRDVERAGGTTVWVEPIRA